MKRLLLLSLILLGSVSALHAQEMTVDEIVSKANLAA